MFHQDDDGRVKAKAGGGGGGWRAGEDDDIGDVCLGADIGNVVMEAVAKLGHTVLMLKNNNNKKKKHTPFFVRFSSTVPKKPKMWQCHYVYHNN